MDPITGMAIAQGASSIINSGLGRIEEQIWGKSDRAKQLDQQGKLDRQSAGIMHEYGEQSADAAQLRQLQLMREAQQINSPQERLKLLQQAGLSPSMMMAEGFGGQGSGQAAMGITQGTGAKADTPAEAKKGRSAEQSAATGTALMGKQMELLDSEIDLNRSEAERNRGSANKDNALTKTEEEKRVMLIENMRQEGITKWFDNIAKEFAHGGNKTDGWGAMRNPVYNVASYLAEDTIEGRKLLSAVVKTEAEIGNLAAQELLTNNKAMGYFQELLNATKMADSREMEVIAKKLAAEWNTGEFTNWKTWTDLANKSINTLGNVVTKGVNASKPPTKIIKNNTWVTE